MQAIFLGVLLAAVAAIFLLFFFLKKRMEKELETQFLKVSQEALKSAIEQITLVGEQRINAEQRIVQADLAAKKDTIEAAIQGLKEELEKYKSLMREFEADRSRKYGQLENELKNTSFMTQRLQETTGHLTNILGNVKLRGQWGERMAEDIIRGCGLLEGVNYLKQVKQDVGGTKPDFTFLLPNQHVINMDVKFPLDNYLLMVNAPEDGQKQIHKKDFLRNVAMRVKEIQDRSYINPSENTLDFVLLFIPNEQVFGFIQEEMPGFLDDCLKQKVVLCSPFTLYAMLCVIRQAFENFRYENSIKDIVKMIDLFAKGYDLFKERFERLGKTLEGVTQQYEDIKDKSFKTLEGRMKRIDHYKKGSAVPDAADKSFLDVEVE